MTGEELYELWRSKLAETSGCAADPWCDIDELDIAAWNATAKALPK